MNLNQFILNREGVIKQMTDNGWGDLKHPLHKDWIMMQEVAHLARAVRETLEELK